MWDVDHPYYCHDRNYYSNQSTRTYESWRAWHDEHAGMDVDLNLVFRWDWITADGYREDAGEEPWWGNSGLLRLYIMGQRKGLFRVDRIAGMRPEDEPEVIAVLRPHWSRLIEMWSPLAACMLADALPVGRFNEVRLALDKREGLAGAPEPLFLWHLTQTVVDGWDTYSDCVVVAATEDYARKIEPDGMASERGTWSAPEHVTATKIGIAVGREAGDVVCASFHAG